MGRLVLIIMIAFALPPACWFAWRWLQARRERAAVEAAAPPIPGEALRWQEAPWLWLIVTGLALSLAAVIGFSALTDYGDDNCQPVPAQTVDGRLVPAHCK